MLTNFSRMQKRDSSGCPFFNLLYQSSILRFLNTLRPQFSLVDRSPSHFIALTIQTNFNCCHITLHCHC
ncbi:hypothetical protein FNO41_00675 [Escherichia coli]|nr:hypothetical protein [Escherichia coli]EFB5190655.1 hypothetical protein [Escherichia coli]EFC4446403.1 hypothetical protein [Escherichia coli]EFE7670758.1 hypothetical protein [Escherichia coli]EFO1153705.1 hypothetical protein [Escherichia coli]